MAGSGKSIKAGEAYVLLSLRDQLTKGLRSASRQLVSFGKSMATVGAGILGAGIAGGALLMPTIKAASDMQETMGKFNTVFGDQSDATKAWADGFAAEVGRSKQQIASFMAGSQDLFVPLGFEPGAANKLSQTLTSLAVDLASFNNMADEDALRDLHAALTGSGEVMKKYGVIVSEAAVKQELLNQGMDPRTASEQAKVQARLNIILRGTTAAHGDAVRTGDSYANQLKRMQANVDDLKVELGTQLLPVATEIVAWFGQLATSMSAWAKEHKELFPLLVKGVLIVAGVGAGLIAAGTAAMVAGKLFAAAAVVTSGAFALITSPLALVAAALAGGAILWAKYTDSGRNATERLKNGLLDFRDIGMETFDGVREALMDGNLSDAAEIAMAGFGAAWSEGLAKLMENWGTWITAIVETAAGAFQEIASLWAKTQGAIAETLITASEQDSPMFRGMLAGFGLGSLNPDTMLGVDMQAEQARRDRLNAELGLGPESVFDQARQGIDTQTDARVSAIEGRVGEFMSAFSEWADPAALRAAADARRQDLETTRAVLRDRREMDRQQREQATAEAPNYETAASEGLAAAQSVASAGTFSAWALRGMFGATQAEEQLKEAKAATYELRAIHGVLKKSSLVVVG